MNGKMKFDVSVTAVTNWRFDSHEESALASHEGGHAARVRRVDEEEEDKTESNDWDLKTLPVCVTVEVDCDDPIPETEEGFQQLEYRFHDQIVGTAVEFLSGNQCKWDLLKPDDVEFEVCAVWDGLLRIPKGRVLARKRNRDVVLFLLNCLVRRLNDEDAVEPWLADGIPDDVSDLVPEELVKDVADMEITDDEYESMVRLAVRTVAREVFPDVEFGNRSEKRAFA